jgi:hypothetical protein
MDSLNAFRVKSDEREPKSAPELVLELVEDMARYNHKNPISATSAL